MNEGRGKKLYKELSLFCPLSDIEATSLDTGLAYYVLNFTTWN